ncbi:uncharacterized protein [Sinocyclocheilus grahami]|uniref:uncharacterized protein isoform X2 n=1 Tax=Sinocyclocheilus grahami TaxID=75366 RepID=UPI0007AC5FA4|nr:PREDICTED: uncharacterized protein LOC107575365 isoform X2 [Sinocyclocheilus grahami]
MCGNCRLYKHLRLHPFHQTINGPELKASGISTRKAMDSKISMTSQSLTTAEDMRNQTKLMMQPYANWEEYLTPAPLSIAIMGELVFISSSTDFSINKNPPKDGYKFIKYPDSFRACLMQVCNSGWWAFNEAHTSMDQIRLHTAQVPDYMKTAVKILFQGDDEVVKAHLPDQLDNIRVIADECLKLSDATEKRFNDVIKIIQELLEACVNAEHFYGEEKETIKKKLEESKLREQSAQETKKRTAKAVSAMEKELVEAHESYKKAMDSLPGGWNMIGMDVVGGITQSVTGLINGLTSVITHPVRNMCSATTKIADTWSHIRDQESVRDVVAEINAYSKSAEILKCVQNIQQLMNVESEDDDIDWTNLYDQKNKCTESDFINQQFRRITDGLKKIPDCPAKKRAQNLCKNGIELCNQLAKYAPDGKCDKDKSTKIIQEVLHLIESAQVFDCKSKDITNSPAIAPTPPMMYKEGNKSENMSASQKATENARFSIEQNRAQLNKTRETYDKCVENLQNNEKELTEILVAMRNCKLKEIDFNTTIEMLVKGMDAMGRVKEQWEKMVHFFQMVSNIVKTSLSKTLTNFVSTSEKTQTLSYNAKLFSKDLLYTQAFQACNIASLVHMISGTYTDVSNKYLMDRVSSLGKLMAMDKSKPEFEHERQLLQNGCDEAQKGILKLVLKNKEEFDRKSTARLEKINQELLAILPAAPPEKIKRIEEAVQAGFSEEEAASYT